MFYFLDIGSRHFKKRFSKLTTLNFSTQNIRITDHSSTVSGMKGVKNPGVLVNAVREEGTCVGSRALLL